jgi:hypothetical protein
MPLVMKFLRLWIMRPICGDQYGESQRAAIRQGLKKQHPPREEVRWVLFVKAGWEEECRPLNVRNLGGGHPER